MRSIGRSSKCCDSPGFQQLPPVGDIVIKGLGRGIVNSYAILARRATLPCAPNA